MAFDVKAAWKEPSELQSLPDLLRARASTLASACNGHGESLEKTRLALSDWRNVVAITYYRISVVCMDEGLEVFDLMDTNKNGELSHSEIKAAQSDPDVVAFIQKNGDSPLLLLQEPEALAELLDQDKNASISRHEWLHFLGVVVEQHLKYLHIEGLLHKRKFWGYGQAAYPPMLLDRGWAEDFWFCIKNEHPLLGICLHDRESPLSLWERVCIEMTLQAMSLAFAYALASQNADNNAFWNYFQITCFITIPGMLVNHVLVLLFTCPWKRTRYDPARKGIDTCACLGQMVGASVTCVCTLGMVCLLVMFMHAYGASDPPAEDASAADTAHYQANRDSVKGFWASYLLARLQAYVLMPVKQVIMAFNPSRSALVAARGCSLLRGLGLASWQLQRDMVQTELSLAQPGKEDGTTGTTPKPT